VAIHAIGDLAVTNALESIAAARQQFPGDHRDRLEHVQLYRPRDLSLFHDLEVVASVQPVFIPTDWAPADRWFPEQKLGLEDSINGFTAVAAWSARRENKLGSIAAGKWADLTIFNQDLFSLTPDYWADVKTETTVVHGEIVYNMAEGRGHGVKADDRRQMPESLRHLFFE